jgi:hypothetical protein
VGHVLGDEGLIEVGHLHAPGEPAGHQCPGGGRTGHGRALQQIQVAVAEVVAAATADPIEPQLARVPHEEAKFRVAVLG